MTAAKRAGLGRGLGALISDRPERAPETREPTPPPDGSLRMAPLASIRRNPMQPRVEFPVPALEDLAASIREHGILQPLLVRPVEGGYELIAGERRLRAAGMAGLTVAPVRLLELTERQSLEAALIENLQREDLNPIEEAEGVRELMDRYGLTQEAAAERLGRSRAWAANSLRLLKLPDVVRAKVAAGDLSTGHAKVLAGLEIEAEQRLWAERVLAEDLSVRALEKALAGRRPKERVPDLHLESLTDQLRSHLGTAVRIESSRTLGGGRRAKGRIEIEFYDRDDLDRGRPGASVIRSDP